MIEPVVDQQSHQKALRRIEKLWDAQAGSREERELDALATLVDAYERRVFPIRSLSPVEAIAARCEQLGWTRKELEPLIGSRARVSEVMTGRRPLTLAMIRNVHLHMSIPAEVLISSPVAKTVARRGPVAKTPRSAQQRVVPVGQARSRSPARG